MPLRGLLSGAKVLDLNHNSKFVLTQKMGQQIIPMGIYDTLPLDTMGVIMDRDNLTSKGVQVLLVILEKN